MSTTTTTERPGEDIAETCLALLLCLVRDVPRLSAVTKEGRWTRTVFHELPGRTLGLLGDGPAAEKLASLARAFKLEILPCRTADDLRRCHYLAVTAASAALPLLGATELAALLPEAFVVSAVPGAVDAAAAEAALDSGRLAGLGLCLSESAAGHPLARFDSVVFLPAPAGGGAHA